MKRRRKIKIKSNFSIRCDGTTISNVEEKGGMFLGGNIFKTICFFFIFIRGNGSLINTYNFSNHFVVIYANSGLSNIQTILQ